MVTVRENPPFGGPVAGIDAAIVELDRFHAQHPAAETWLLACDLPRAELIVAQLRDVPIPADADGVILRDATGRDQWLAGRYRIASLRAALAALPDVHDVAMRTLVASLKTRAVDDRVGAAFDLDTWADVEHYRDQETTS